MQSSPFLPGKPTGFTLLELMVVLALLGVSISGLIHAARGQTERMSVLAAREAVVGLLHRARQEAVSRGGSELVVRTQPPSVSLIAGLDTLTTLGLAADFGVEISLSRGREEATLRYGPLGLGQIASQTLRFRKGGSEALLVVSSMGRVTRR